jgi:hypothetical protein
MNKTEIIELLSSLLVLAFGTLILWVGLRNFSDVKLLELMLIVLGVRLIK